MGNQLPVPVPVETGNPRRRRWGRCSRRLSEQGFTLVEVVIAGGIGVVMFLGIGSFYISTLRIHEQSNTQTELQRQAALVLEEISKQVRPASALFVNTCNGVPDALTVRNARGDYCFYQDADNQLVEQLPPPDGTRNLLSGSPKPNSLAPGSLSFTINGRQVQIQFTLSDGIIDPWVVNATLKRRN